MAVNKTSPGLIQGNAISHWLGANLESAQPIFVGTNNDNIFSLTSLVLVTAPTWIGNRFCWIFVRSWHYANTLAYRCSLFIVHIYMLAYWQTHSGKIAFKAVTILQTSIFLSACATNQCLSTRLETPVLMHWSYHSLTLSHRCLSTRLR